MVIEMKTLLDKDGKDVQVEILFLC